MSKHSAAGALAPVLHAATNPYRFGALRGVLAALMSVVLMVGSTAYFVWDDLSGSVKSNTLDISGLGAQSGEAKQKDEPPADSFKGRAVNILVVGIDSREDQGAGNFGTTADVEGVRGDTTMLVHISADRSRVQIVSIPRDLLTTIPPCTRTDGSVSDETFGMFNSALTIGANWGYDVASGIACTKATTELLTGLDIDAFTVVDFKGFEGMVNALGGVWYDFDEAVKDAYAGLNLPAGCQKLDGAQALAYARARHDLGDGSDIERIARQQQLVAAILRQALSKNYVTDLPALVSFVKQALESLQTSPNLSSLNSDVGLLLSVASIDKKDIQFVTMPWEVSPDDDNRVAPSEPLASQLWAALVADEPLPVGIDYTDGTGATGTVKDTTAQSGAQSGTPTPSGPPTTTPDSGTSPTPTPTPTTTIDTCPPADKSAGTPEEVLDVWGPAA